MSDMKCPNIKIYKCSDGFVTDNAQVAKSHEANIKSNKLICPVCGGELEVALPIVMVLGCPKCKLFGCIELYERLETTRTALGVAVDALNGVCRDLPWVKRTLEQINEITKGGKDEL